jgi:Resolvase, N terminal domain
MKIGYGPVSTRDQNPGAQRDALAAVGCDQVFIDKASGKLACRPELDRALLVAPAEWQRRRSRYPGCAVDGPDAEEAVAALIAILGIWPRVSGSLSCTAG